MNVLMVTNDASVLRDGSAAQSLLKEQASVVNRLMVIVLNSHGESLARKVTDSLWLFPTNSWMSFLKMSDALYVVRHEIFFRNRLQADIIVANDPSLAGFTGYLIAKQYRKPLHIHIAQDLFSAQYVRLSVFHFLRSIGARLMISRTSTVSVALPKARDSLAQKDPAFADRITVIPRYIDVSAIQAQPVKDDLHLKYTQFRAIMLVVAPLIHEHNIQVGIDVLAEVSKYYQNIGLVIVGNGPQRSYLAKYAQKLGVSQKVIFETSRDDLVSYYKTAQLFMVPSLYEEYETTIEEAAAAGCAIVSSRVGIAPNIIEHEKSGYLCNPKVPSEFWNAADMLIHNVPVRENIRKNILLSIQAYMSNDKKGYMKLYKTAWESALKGAV